MTTFPSELVQPLQLSGSDIAFRYAFVFGTSAPLANGFDETELLTHSGVTFSGNGAEFIDDNNYLTLSDVVVTDNFTAVMKITALETGRFQGILAKSTGTDNQVINCYLRDNNELAFLVSKTGSIYEIVKFDYTPYFNEEHTLAFVYDGLNIMIYIDGVVMNSAPCTGALHNSTDNVVIGAYEWSGGTNDFNGIMEYCYFDFNQALTAADIAQITAEPYQIFQTQEQEQQNYHYQFDGSGGGFRVEGLAIGINSYEITLSADIGGVGGGNYGRYICDGRTNPLGSGGGYTGYIYAQGISNVSNMAVNGVAATYTEMYDAVKGDVISFDVSTSHSGTSMQLGAKASTQGSALSVAGFESIKITNADGVHFFDLNVTFGTVIKSKTSSLQLICDNPADDGRGSVRAIGVSDGLLLNGVDQYITIPNIPATVTDFEIELHYLDIIDEGDNLQLLDFSRYTHGFYAIVDSATKQVRVWINNVTLTFSYVFPSLDISNLLIRFVFTHSTKELSLYINDVFIETLTSTTVPIFNNGTSTIGSGGHDPLVKNIRGTLVYLSVTDPNDTNNDRYWDGTAVRSNELPELLHEQNGVMVNFNDIYVPEKSKELIGQEFEGTQVVVDGSEWGHTSNDNFELSIKFSTTQTVCCLAGLDIGYNGVVIDSDTLKIYLSNTIAQFSTPNISSGDTHTLIITYNNTTLDVDVNYNGDQLDTVTLATNKAFRLSQLGRDGSSTNPFIGSIYNFDYLKGATETDRRTLDFSIDAGDTIVDTSGNDNHGQVIGNALRRVYSYSGWGEIAGYRVLNRQRFSIKDATLPTKAGLVVKYFLEADINNTDGTYKRLFATNDNLVRVSTTNGGASDALTNIINLEIDGVPSSNAFDAKAGQVLSFEINAVNSGVYHYFGNYFSGDTESTGCVFSKIEVWDGATQIRNYDATTGDINLMAGGTYTPYVIESIGNNHGELVGGVTYDETGATFDGSTGYVSISSLSPWLESTWELYFIGEIVDQLSLGKNSGDTGYCYFSNSVTHFRYYLSNRIIFNVDLSSYTGIHKFSIKKVSYTEHQLLVDDVIVATDNTDTTSYAASPSFVKVGVYSSDYSESIYQSFGMVSSNDSRTYDFTNIKQFQTGGTIRPAIEETLHGFHATFVGNDATETSGFMPVFENYVLTVNSDGSADYTHPKNFTDDRKGLAGIQHGVLQERFVGSPSSWWISSVDNTITKLKLSAAQGKEFKGDATDPNVAGFELNGTTFNFQDPLIIEGLFWDAGGSGSGDASLTAQNSYIKSSGRVTRVDNCIVDFNISYAKIESALNTIFTGNVYTNTAGTNYIYATNCLFTGDDAISGGGNKVISNGFFKQASESLSSGSVNNTFSVDFTNAFNADGTIEQTWYDANLKGNGWNNTDPVSWAVREVVSDLVEGSLTIGTSTAILTTAHKYGLGIITENGTTSLLISGIKVGVDVREGYIDVTLSLPPFYLDTAGSKIANGSQNNDIVLSYNISSLKESDSSISESATTQDINEGRKETSNGINENINNSINTTTSKTVTSNLTEAISSNITSVSSKLINSIVTDVLSSIDILVGNKVGVSSVSEAVSNALYNTGTKNGYGTSLQTLTIEDNIYGAKVTAGTKLGRIQIDLTATLPLLGTKDTTGSLTSDLNQNIVINTLKYFESDIIEAINQSTIITGAKHSDGVVINSATLAMLVDGVKEGTGNYFLTVDVNSNLNISGSKTTSSNVEESITILDSLTTEIIKTGNISIDEALTMLLVGANLDKSHIARLETILGTVNLRYKPITGVL